MNDGLLSPHWYRIANLKPQLLPHVHVHRNDYRGLIWYILEDSSNNRNHRFNPAAYQFIGLFDGKKTVDEIYRHISELLGDYSPGQQDIVELLGQLYNADLIKTDNPIDTDELIERKSKRHKAQLRQRISNPVALKIPLWDPEEFLNRSFPAIRWIYSYPVALLWLVLMIYSLTQVLVHGDKIAWHFSVNTLAPYNLLLMVLLYPIIKILHEFGHAFSVKHKGGEVHEMGINLLMFMPIPYVNVSAATHFRSKYQRILVSAAGILVESFLAALGLLLFLATEPGIVQDIGFNIFIIGGVSSLFFNGNPLLKYDGYYILADAADIPNLYQRSGQYWRYFFQRYLLGLKQITTPASAPGETLWFIGYGILSQLYRLAVLWFIFVVVTEKFFLLGILLSVWLLTLQYLIPLGKAILFLWRSPSLNRGRIRALASIMALVLTLVALLGYMPIPTYTRMEGVVWQPDEALIKARQDGFAGEIEADRDEPVSFGTVVLRLNDPFLTTEARIAEARVDELRARHRAERSNRTFEAGIVQEELNIAVSELAHVREKQDSMEVMAFKDGRSYIPEADDLPGSFIRKGELIGYILDSNASIVRMVVRQDHIGQLRERVENIEIRFANDIWKAVDATIIRQSPEGTNQLPSRALSTQGGGSFVLSPDGGEQLLVSEKVFLVDLEFASGAEEIPLGTRAYVRIDHGNEPIATQIIRRVRQIFLRQLNV